MGERGNPWAVMATLCVGSFITVLDTTIVNIAIPDILADLNATITEVLWAMSAYILVVAALVITAGRMGDIVGPRDVFIAGMILFAVASALCGPPGNPGSSSPPAPPRASAPR